MSGIGRKAILINGNVPAANFLRLPKVGASSLGLTGRFLYAQVKLDPERFYVVHIDCLCADSYAQSPVKTTAGARVGRQTVRLSLSNLYKQKKGEKYAHLAGSAVNVVYEPPVRGWSVLVFDIPALLQQAGITDRYDCVKAIQLGAAMAARNVFTSDTLYAEHNMPKEMALSAKPDAVFDIVHVGELPPAVPAPSPPVAPERFQSAFAGDFVDDVDDDVGASPAPVATFALRENNVAPGGEGPCHGAPRRVVLFVCPGLVFFPSARDDRPCVRPDLDASTAGVRFRPFSLGSAIDDMIAAGLTATAAARMRSRSRLTKSKAPAQSKAEKAHHASFAASVEEAKTARVPKSPLKPALDQNRSRSPPRSDSPGRERSRGVSGKSPAKKNIPLTAAAAGKPRNPTMGRTTTNAEGVDTGFFGAGGAGGLVNHRAQVFQVGFSPRCSPACRLRVSPRRRTCERVLSSSPCERISALERARCDILSRASCRRSTLASRAAPRRCTRNPACLFPRTEKPRRRCPRVPRYRPRCTSSASSASAASTRMPSRGHPTARRRRTRATTW